MMLFYVQRLSMANMTWQCVTINENVVVLKQVSKCFDTPLIERCNLRLCYCHLCRVCQQCFTMLLPFGQRCAAKVTPRSIWGRVIKGNVSFSCFLKCWCLKPCATRWVEPPWDHQDARKPSDMERSCCQHTGFQFWSLSHPVRHMSEGAYR